MGILSAPFWCLCWKLSLSPLYFNKTLLHKISERSSLVSGPRLNSSPPEATNPMSHHSATTFHLGGSSRILQNKVRMLGALVLCSPSEHVFCYTLLTLWCACVNEWNALREASEEPCSAVPRRPHKAYGRNLSGVYTDLPMPRGNQCLLQEPSGVGKSCGPNSPFSVKLFGLWPFHNSLGIRSTNLTYRIIGFQGACDLCCYSSVV